MLNVKKLLTKVLTKITAVDNKVIFGSNNTAVRFASNPTDGNAYASMQIKVSHSAWYELIMSASGGLQFRRTSNGGQSYEVIWNK